ncbi:MAG: AgmX/PglI C-terminal domain-containing protein [Polyangiaceae bacterium]|nr:AgmX/PglI C-terminal domain-containing protein [Polyangiaceae bacterium]
MRPHPPVRWLLASIGLALTGCPPAEAPRSGDAAEDAGLTEGPSDVELPPLPEGGSSAPSAAAEPGVVPVRPPDSRPTGTLPPAVTAPALEPTRARVHACYEAGLARDPALAGRVVVRLTVEPDGRVGRTEPHEPPTLGDPAVVTCIEEVLRGVRFPAPKGGRAVVLVPYEFAPADAGAARAEGGAG